MIHSTHALLHNNSNNNNNNKGLGTSTVTTTFLTSEILLSTAAIFVAGYFLRIPLSVTSSLTGMLTGISIVQQLPIDNIYISYVIAVWTIGPIVSIVTGFYSMKAMSKSAPKNLWSRIKLYKGVIIAASFLTAYATGANTLGLIVAIGGGFDNNNDIIQLSIAIVSIILGSLFLSVGQIKRVGTEIYSPRYSGALTSTLTSAALILFASGFGIPLSSTQTLSASVFGAGLSNKDRFMAMKPFLMVVAGWIIAPLVSLGIGMVLVRVPLR
jgi:PiT family inorganic phosphate transporter